MNFWNWLQHARFTVYTCAAVEDRLGLPLILAWLAQVGSQLLNNAISVIFHEIWMAPAQNLARICTNFQWRLFWCVPIFWQSKAQIFCQHRRFFLALHQFFVLNLIQSLQASLQRWEVESRTQGSRPRTQGKSVLKKGLKIFFFSRSQKIVSTQKFSGNLQLLTIQKTDLYVYFITLNAKICFVPVPY